MTKQYTTSALRRAARAMLLATCSAVAGTAHALSPSEFFTKVSPSVWLVITFDKEGTPLATGSAVVIAPHTLVTNCHVLKNVHSFQLQNDRRRYIGRLEMWDTPRDVCQVKASLDAPAVELGDSNGVVVGQPVYALGAPKGLELTLSNGLVSGLRRDDARRLVQIQTSAPISHGSSGGGLFDNDGRLIGITSQGVEDGQNLGFALPVSWVRELPARHRAALGLDPRPVASTAATMQSPEPAPLPPPLPVPDPPPPVIAQPSRTPSQRPAPAPAPAPTAPVVAAAGVEGQPRVPYLNDARQAQYRAFLASAAYPRACAISDNGHWACADGNRPRDRSLPSDPKERALRRCAEVAGRECFVYQIDDRIVFRPPAVEPPQP